MILTIDSIDGVVKLGSPPEDLPGIMESIKVSDSLLIDDADVQGRSGKVKVVRGWDDADILITLSLIDDPGSGKTRWEFLKQIASAFKKVAGNGKPEIYSVSHPMLNAWNTKKLLFSSLETTESRTRRKITVALEFVEYDSAAGISQDRRNAAQNAKPAAARPPDPIVSDRQRRGLGSMENRFANK